MTNHSQSASTSPTCSTTTSVACLSSAARAAVTAQSRVSSVLLSVRVLRSSGGSDIGAQHDGDIERVRLASVLDDAPGSQGVAKALSALSLSRVVVAHLGLARLDELVSVADDHDLRAGRYDARGGLKGVVGLTRAVEEPDARPPAHRPSSGVAHEPRPHTARGRPPN